MKLRIETETIGGVAVVQIHGRLAGNGVNELEKICRLGGRPLALDLSNLYSVDPRGIDFIRSLVKEGVDLIGISPYIKLLLAVVEQSRAARKKSRRRLSPGEDSAHGFLSSDR